MQRDARQSDHHDRRADPRRATRVDALLEHPGGVLSGRVVDMSFGGAKFVTESVAPVLEIGCQTILIVTPRGDALTEELTWNGTVVRCERSGDDGPARIAYAIAFDDSEPRPIPGKDDLDELD